MDIVTAARAQMGMSLAFHMVFAAMGIGLPLLMVIAEGLYLRTGREHYRRLAKKWGKATGLLFAIGAVSGTALSFELGLLWPHFMEKAGSLVGPAFALEGFAFFIEAIFLGLYLYGWDRLSPFAHWMTGWPVVISGALSGILVVAVNAWMQVPVGFELDAAGNFTNIDPMATFLSPVWIDMAIHSTLSCYIAVAFAVAGVYAWGMLRGKNDDYTRAGIVIPMIVGTVTALLQPVSGDFMGRNTARYQPIKLAAMESHFETERGAALVIGGIPNEEEGKVDYAIKIPKLLSLLATHDPDGEVQGLNDFPRDQWPNVLWTHIAFQLMVGCGVLLILLSLWFWVARWRGGFEGRRWLLRGLLVASPLGFVALEAGWFVTELGRQPWTIYGIMRTHDAATPSPDVPISFFGFTLLYLLLAVVLVVLLLRLARDPAMPMKDPVATR